MEEKLTPGEFLRRVRKSNRESQSQVSHRMGLSYDAVSALENGKTKISSKNIEEITGAYKLKTREIKKLKKVAREGVQSVTEEDCLFERIMLLPKSVLRHLVKRLIELL